MKTRKKTNRSKHAAIVSGSASRRMSATTSAETSTPGFAVTEPLDTEECTRGAGSADPEHANGSDAQTVPCDEHAGNCEVAPVAESVHPASSIVVSRIRVSLVLKGKDFRRSDILDCLRLSVSLKNPAGEERRILMTDWRFGSAMSSSFSGLVASIRKLSKAPAGDVSAASAALWKQIVKTARAAGRKRSVLDRFRTAKRKSVRQRLLDSIRATLRTYAEKEAGRCVRPSDIAKIWKELEGEVAVRGVMEG